MAEAIEEVSLVIASLRQVLDQMEEILEILELAEVQKTADEREIQALRQSLRQADRRSGGGSGRRPEQSRGGHEHSQEREGDQRGSDSGGRDERRQRRE